MVTLEKYKEAYRKIVVEDERRSFMVHVSVYIFVNLLLLIINLTYTPQQLWFFFPLLGWGIGLAGHYMDAYKWAEKNQMKKEAEAMYRANK
ncbi:MAG: 2TM domain-containing protein [Nanobdellota archaeon]